ncbi:MAG: helix-turn-helix domain-containing protein [Alphaproteobacteria bacterium]|nr:helix-turn-helix domain-containing protein [Alphaproteobacteria bacterium]
MERFREKPRALSVAQRGQVIQRVLVDGWSAAETAAAFRIEESRVEAWLADYRGKGMASLHRERARMRMPRRGPSRWVHIARLWLDERLPARQRSPAGAAAPVVIRSGQDRRGRTS